MKPIKDLTDNEINYWVAKAQGWTTEHITPNKNHYFSEYSGGTSPYHPTTSWQQAGELLEKFKPAFGFNETSKTWDSGYRKSHQSQHTWYKSDNPRKAICLAVIASVYGDEVKK